MIPFRSPRQMIDAHAQMWGDPGRRCAEMICHWAERLFAVALDPCRFRVALAPIEMGPYNKHAGYNHALEGDGYLILANRHICFFDADGNLALYGGKNFERIVGDFLVHEMTHTRQRQILGTALRRGSRGMHRDRGWYGAIAEACPRYLGARFAPEVWPKQLSRRVKGENGELDRIKKYESDDRIDEVTATHWPESFRALIARGDKRLLPAT